MVTLGRVRLAPTLGRGQAAMGTIVGYWHERRYGLIAPDDGSAELFVHGSMLRRRDRDRLTTGDRVRFWSTRGERRDLITRARLVETDQSVQ